MLISEIFGRSVLDVSPEASAIRSGRQCPFRSSVCTKSSKTDPIGVCTLSDGREAAVVCPVRFLDGDRIFCDAARLAFSNNCEFAVFPEVRILRISSEVNKKEKKIGKVDFLLGQIEAGRVTDFAALEVQAVYFSGARIRPAMEHFLQHRDLDKTISDRRPDFRSSAQKRLVPQLQLKVPVFRRWGKRFFVVVDSQFFRSLPKFKRSPVSNSEIVWLSYPIKLNGTAYTMESPEVAGTQWDEVITALREGEAPEQHEILQELQHKFDAKSSPRPKLIKLPVA